MWTEQLSDGRVKYRERYTDYMTGKEKKVSVTMPKDSPKYRKEAYRILQEKIEKSKQRKPETITISEVVDIYNKYIEKTLKSSTVLSNKYSANKVASIIGKDVIVERLTAGYVLDKFMEDSESNSVINYHIRILKKVIRFAYQNDLTENISFLDKLKTLPITKEAKVNQKYLEKEELQKLIDYIPKDRHKHLVEVLAFSGMRIGELLALDIEDVDFINKEIKIHKTYDYRSCTVHDTPKTDTSKRNIIMQPELEIAMRNLIRTYREYGLSHGVRMDAVVFTKYGKRLGQDQVIRMLKRYSERAIGRKITIHCLRHTHTSLLAENGMLIDDISERLGHHDSKITKEIYLHATEKMKEKRKEAYLNIKIL